MPTDHEAAKREPDIGKYAIALQRAIEYHCKGKDVPVNVAVECPHHARMLNDRLAASIFAPQASDDERIEAAAEEIVLFRLRTLKTEEQLRNQITTILRKHFAPQASGEGRGEADLPARVLEMCKARDWCLKWTARGAYLHLEASELIEAVRGKDPKGRPPHIAKRDEAADVLMVLMSITESQGVPWGDVVSQAGKRTEELLVSAGTPYKGEERATPPAAPSDGAMVGAYRAFVHCSANPWYAGKFLISNNPEADKSDYVFSRETGTWRLREGLHFDEQFFWPTRAACLEFLASLSGEQTQKGVK